MSALGINVSTQDPTFGFEAIAPARIIPAYLAEAIGDRNIAHRAYIAACDELETLTGNEEAEEHEMVMARIDAAWNVCLIADDRYRQAYQRYDLEQLELANSLVRANATREYTPNLPQFPPADRLLEGQHANVPTQRMAVYSESRAGWGC